MARWIAIFGDDYAVSDDGRVQRLTDGKNTYAGKVLKPILQKVGYYSVRLGGRVHAYVHDLVTESFIGPKPTGFEVNHKDGVKTNNYIINLEYVRHARNMAHASEIGLFRTGDENPRIKLSDASVREIRRRRDAGDIGVTAMAKEYGVSPSTICQVGQRQRRRTQ